MYKQIAAMIRISGYEATNNERILAEVFAENEGHHSLSGLKALFKEATGHNISIREIKRFMNFMCEYGAAEKKDFPEGAHYEHRHIGEHHDHLICSKCGQVVEFEREALEELQSKIAK
ncbi:MAG: hypothetical protein HN521_12285, partial [Candidatus Latescibacteria bacterium]|nr:hypothetical protein [Candidatus Latescibacterota bacterium]